jgi:hypothetical protein
MISFPERICPLCSHVFANELLHNHITSEYPRVRQSTIEVIRAYHPGWVEDDGACGPCWRLYRNAGRILDQMRHAKSQNAPGYRNPVALAGEGHDKDQASRRDTY